MALQWKSSHFKSSQFANSHFGNGSSIPPPPVINGHTHWFGNHWLNNHFATNHFRGIPTTIPPIIIVTTGSKHWFGHHWTGKHFSTRHFHGLPATLAVGSGRKQWIQQEWDNNEEEFITLLL